MARRTAVVIAEIGESPFPVIDADRAGADHPHGAREPSRALLIL